MEEIKEIAIIAGLSVWALLCIYVIRRVRTINREVKAKEDAERKSLEKWEKFKAGTLHPAQVFIDNELLQDSPNIRLKVELDELRKLDAKRKSYKPIENRELTRRSSTKDEVRIDGTDYSAAQIILGASDYMSDPDPSPGHSSYEGNGYGGDFGGGGASGSWDSGSDSSNSYDSGSSDSGSSWSD